MSARPQTKDADIGIKRLAHEAAQQPRPAMYLYQLLTEQIDRPGKQSGVLELLSKCNVGDAKSLQRLALQRDLSDEEREFGERLHQLAGFPSEVR